MDEIAGNRDFMKCMGTPDSINSDKQKGIPSPPLFKAAAGEVIELPEFGSAIKQPDYSQLLEIRRSVRAFKNEPVTGEQLAFMLWSTQGVLKVRKTARFPQFRTVASAGARHTFELYAAIRSADGLNPGVYHYLPGENVGKRRAAVEFVTPIENYKETMTDMLHGQKWAALAPFVLFFTCIPYRAEWNAGHLAHRVILIDAGHVGQNVMLSASSLGLGSCCMAAFNNERCNEVIGLDGENEFTVYAAAVGTPKNAGKINNNIQEEERT